MATMASSIEQELREAVRRHRRREAAQAEAEAERDAAIRGALSAGVPRRKIVQITGLSPQRIDQIRRGARL